MIGHARAGRFAQKDERKSALGGCALNGLYAAQEQYFQTFLVLWGPSGANWRIPVFPGGYLIGSVLLVNLIAAHLKRFKFSRKKIGIFFVHAGLILL